MTSSMAASELVKEGNYEIMVTEERQKRLIQVVEEQQRKDL